MRRYALAAVVAGCGFRGPNTTDDAQVVDGEAVADGAPMRVDAAPSDTASSDATPIDATPIDAVAAAILLRQINNATNGANVGTISVTFVQPQLAGDLNVVVVGWFMPGTVTSVVDTSGNAYAIATGPSASGPENQALYYKCGIAAAAANANTVTVTFAGANQQPDVHVVEYSGTRVGACLDRAMATIGNGTAMSVGPLLTTHPHDLLVASTFQVNQATAGDPAYTSRGINNFGDLVEDREVSATGNYTALATQDSAGAWVMLLAAFEGM